VTAAHPDDVAADPRVRGRIPGLDGARGLAAVSIVVVHSVGLLGPAYSAPAILLAEAVVFFFALSGFLVHLPFARAIESGGRFPGLRRYSSQRVRRIFPAWLVTFVVANLVLAAVYVDNVATVAEPRSDAGTGRFTDPERLLAHLSLVANLMPSELQTGISPSWSLTTELSFYLVLPPLAWLVWRRARRRGGGSLLVAATPGLVLLVACLAGTFWAQHLAEAQGLGTELARWGPNWTSVLSRSIAVQGGAFGAGMVVAALFARLERGGLPGLGPRRVRLVAVPVLLLSALGCLVAIGRAHQLDAWLFALTSGAVILLIVEPTARRRDSRWVRLWDVAPVAFLGRISLSLYLWHYPVLVLMARHDLVLPETALGTLGNTALVLATSVAVAAASYRWVELPFLRVRRAG
jgi:peptidoglycan/LPS O-acetylase OafA/YrhL